MRRSPRSEDTQQLGADAEHAAELWLQTQGLSTIARNWRCKLGEIDRIMWDRNTVVFVEVRSRSRSDFGGAGSSITFAKQRRLQKAAELFLMQHPPLQRHPCRFDVMLGSGTQPAQWQWIRNALNNF